MPNATLALLTLVALTLLGCPGTSQRSHSTRDAARGDAGLADDEWSDEDPYVEDEEESGAGDPEEDPTGEDPTGEDPTGEDPTAGDTEDDLLDDADLDPEDPADAEWLEELGDEGLEEGATEAEESTGSCSARCCDGTLALDDTSEDEGQCVRETPALCEEHGSVLRARWEDEIAYRRGRACFARCAYRAGYRRLYGVTRGCTAQAAAYCEAPDRGGLADATWSRCTPT